MQHRPTLAALLLTGIGCTGHTTDDDLRQAWLVEAIGDENRVWLSRDTELLATKYARMADDAYNYMRGTTGIAFADWSRPGTDRQPTQFATSTEASTVLLVGDPHLENVGTYLPGDAIEPASRLEPIALWLECTDFDAAGYGPWNLDARRSMLGLAVLLHQSACDEACVDRVLEDWATAYVDELGRQQRLDDPWNPAMTGDGAGIAETLVHEAIQEGLLRKRLLQWTDPTTEGRRFRFDRALDRQGRGTLPLQGSEAAQLDRLLAAWGPEAPPGFRRMDVGRRYGQGVSSIPAIRYVVLYDRGQDGIEDDGIVGFREVVDPPAIPGLVAGLDMRWDSNGNRVTDAARTLWSRPDADPRLASVTDGDLTFKVVTASSFNEGLAHERIARDSFETADPELALSTLADTLARQLAATHARSRTWAGGSALEAIGDDLEGREQRFVSEAVLTAREDLEQTLRDHRLFVDALEDLGPLLGADRLGF